MKPYCILSFLILLISQCRPKEQNYITQFPGKPETPSFIKREHEQLLEHVQAFTLFQDSAGLVAIKLHEIMEHHFQEEEDYVLPPLGLLPLLAGGQLPENSREIIGLTDKLQSQLSHLNAEHQLIKAHMDEMLKTSAAFNHPEIKEFEKQLLQHAKVEEEIYFPAALVIGENLKVKTQSKHE